MTADIRRHLETMLDILDEKEWIQGALFEDARGRRGDQNDIFLEDVTGRCLAGAYTYGTLSGTVRINDLWPVSQIIVAVVKDLFPGRLTCSLPSFNDHKDTTVEDVRLVLKVAIERSSELH